MLQFGIYLFWLNDRKSLLNNSVCSFNSFSLFYWDGLRSVCSAIESNEIMKNSVEKKIRKNNNNRP
jgi:hypothetical protein